jgi:hypothetical protein
VLAITGVRRKHNASRRIYFEVIRLPLGWHGDNSR